MKVTIITVTYNSEAYILDCINSVGRQDYKNIEHIIVDGLSSDNTIKIIRQNQTTVSKWISEKDNGMYDAINKGIQMATGEIIGILNSDDLLASTDVISSIVKCFENKETNTLYGDLVYVDTKDTNKILRIWKGSSYKRIRFSFGWMPAHPTFYMRKSIMEKYGGYDSLFLTAADFEFMSRLLYKYKVSSFYLPKLIIKMRIGGQSNATLSKRLIANRMDYLAMKKNNILFPRLISILKPLRKIPQFCKSFFH